MKKNVLGHVIQVATDIRVLVGIVFLAIEPQQNNDQLSEQSRNGHILGNTTTDAMIILNRGLAKQPLASGH